MDAYDREQAHHQAKEGARNMYDEHYGGYNEYNPDSQNCPSHFESRGYGGGGDGFGGGSC